MIWIICFELCCMCSLEDDALMDPFNIYLQTLLSQALDSDFLEALQQANGQILCCFYFANCGSGKLLPVF